MCGDVKAVEFVDLGGGLGNRPPAAHCEDAPLHFDDVVVPRDNGLVAEGLRIVHTLGHRRVDPVGEGECLLGRVEKGDGMDFFRRLDLHPEEALQPRAPRTFRDRGRIAGGLMVRQRDAVYPRGDRACHDFGRRHLEIRAGTQTTVDMEVEFHNDIIANLRRI